MTSNVKLILMNTLSLYEDRLKSSYNEIKTTVDDNLNQQDPSTAAQMVEMNGPQWGLC